MKPILLIITFLLSMSAHAQVADTIDLKWLHEKVLGESPLNKQKRALEEISQGRSSINNLVFLPQLMVNGQVHYQSDVTQLPIESPVLSVEPLEKDMYKLSLDVNQIVYDGGLRRGKNKLEEAGLRADEQNLEVQKYSLKDQVNVLYFNILYLQEQRGVLGEMKDDLVSRLERIVSGVKNGILLESQADVLRVEILKVEQQMEEMEIRVRGQVDMAGILAGEPLPYPLFLRTPSLPEPGPGLGERPEIPLFVLQKEKLEAAKSVIASRYQPRINAFGQTGYGRPGFNMLKNEFDAFYMIGARISWNIWDWNQGSKEKHLLDLQKDVVDSQRDNFTKIQQINMVRAGSEKRKWEALLSRDDEIITLRERIRLAAASQLENGVITSSEYITEANAEAQARLNRESHRILLYKAKVDQLNEMGISY